MRVLVGECGRSLFDQVLTRLRANFETDWASGVSVLRTMLATRAYTLVVFAADGAEVDERQRLVQEYRYLAPTSHILVVSEFRSAHERVRIIDAGADDCLAMPFHQDELIAKARAVARRCGDLRGSTVSAGQLQLSRRDGALTVAGRPLDLQMAEHTLLTLLLQRLGVLVSKERLEAALGDDDGLTANAIEQRISRLRKILQHARADVQIRTVRGAGYVLEPVSGGGREGALQLVRMAAAE